MDNTVIGNYDFCACGTPIELGQMQCERCRKDDALLAENERLRTELESLQRIHLGMKKLYRDSKRKLDATLVDMAEANRVANDLSLQKSECREEAAELRRQRDALRERVDTARLGWQSLTEYQPAEVVKDDFAYDRLLASVHEFARGSLRAIEESSEGADRG